MADTYTSTLQLSLQADGSHNDGWGDIANLVFAMVDQSVNGVLALNVGGNTNVTLAWPPGTNSGNQANNAIMTFTGVLTGNISVFVPATSRRMLVVNGTTGSFNLTMAVVGTPGSVVVVPRSTQMRLWTDGTNVFSELTNVGPIAITGNLTVSTTLAVTGNSTLTGAAVFLGGIGVANGISTDEVQVTVSAGVVLTNQTDGAAAAVGTLTNAPVAGNPAIWVPFMVNGVLRHFPAW